MTKLFGKPVSRFASDYGMLVVLLLLCLYYSWATYGPQRPRGRDAARRVAAEIVATSGKQAHVLIVIRDTTDDAAYAKSLEKGLEEADVEVIGVVKGQPLDVRNQLQAIDAARKPLDVIACNQATMKWGVLDNLGAKFPSLAKVRTISPKTYWWPNFLKTDNLLNVASQIAVIAIIAIGMTMVIITGGIDLSVGSLIALAAVVAAALIRDHAGAENAGVLGMVLCSLGGIAVCGLVGCFSGCMITGFGIPPFIVTLAMMLVTNGLAYMIAEGQSIYQVPDSYTWLGRGADLLSIPNAVLVMLALYAIAHVVMSRMVYGRYIYAVGGNPEAARLSGVPVRRVILAVYTISGLLAGAGGIIMASQLKSGSPTYGTMYEMYVIAAAVVGGASLAGGEGRILGTLIGAFIIAVIQNGMNLTGVESYTQKVVLGAVILGAVLLDMLKKRGSAFWAALRRRKAES